MNVAYIRFELIRLFRNRQNFIFSLIFPLILLYSIVGASNGGNVVPGISVARYYMAGMIAFGTLAAVTAGGARIALERQVGWNRQLRLTPLSPGTYLRTKVLTSLVMAIISLLLVTGASLTLGVRFPVATWFEIAGLVLVALIPFVALGVLLGHVIKGDSMGPVIGGLLSVFAILGGAYFPIGTGGGFMHYFVRVIPSFWLVQAGKTGVGGVAWTAESWIVVAAWTVVLGAGALLAYQRDTKRQG